VLTAQELAAFRATQEAALPESAVIYARVATVGDSGSTAYSWPLGTETVGRLASHGAPDVYVQMARERGRTPWVVTLPTSVTVQAGDRILIGGHLLSVLGVISGGEWETALRVACIEAK